MTPSELDKELSIIAKQAIHCAVMIWGPPGVGKSSIVSQVAQRNGMQVVDLRLSQLAPTDLRGLPVARDGQSSWYPPSFLPREGRGVLFLDEINMAAPAMQGVAQQLILDRRVGDYRLPEGWLVWAAGNRKADRAAVFDMPSALANRFLHYEIDADINDFKSWALRQGLHEEILGFLLFRPSLLHKNDAKQLAWPSPRSWEMADTLYKAGLSIAPAVGDATAAEHDGYRAVFERLPDLEAILAGDAKVEFPEEPSARYAVVLGLAMRAQDAAQVGRALTWLQKGASGEWIQLFLSDAMTLFRERGRIGELLGVLNSEPAFKKLAAELRDMMVS